MKIGTLLRKLRNKRRMSVRGMADRMAVADKTYLDWEHDRSSPSLELYITLAEALDVDPVVLMAYFTGQAHEVAEMDGKGGMVDLTEVIKFYKNHAEWLGAYKLRVETELARVRERIDRGDDPQSPGQHLIDP
jgi:transcriptional regulator with XRE-family HTH domain